MFIVYSPEGQSFIGASQAIPPLKVDPLKRSNPVEDDVRDGFSFNEDLLSKKKENTASSAAVQAYKSTQKNPMRRVVAKVSEIMSSPVKTISRDSSLEEAWHLMQSEQIKHLPVMYLESLIGICSQRDLLTRVIVGKEGELEGAKRETVADIMQTHVVTTVAETDIRNVANVLTQYDIGALVIMNNFQQPIGIVTRGDIIKRLGNEPPLELYV